MKQKNKKKWDQFSPRLLKDVMAPIRAQPTSIGHYYNNFEKENYIWISKEAKYST